MVVVGVGVVVVVVEWWQSEREVVCQVMHLKGTKHPIYSQNRAPATAPCPLGMTRGHSFLFLHLMQLLEEGPTRPRVSWAWPVVNSLLYYEDSANLRVDHGSCLDEHGPVVGVKSPFCLFCMCWK
ncbi:hypothetical protein HanIR_Chr10g0451871 [Helianthus annuus]|nr:hypothetical protein HanIR_Chr10g0451871 [Helianthus annuus]